MDIKGLQNEIADYCKREHIGGILRITSKDQILFEQHLGMADYARGIPFSGESRFSLYSLSKPFCAIGLLKLFDKGLIDLDAHPSRYVPEAAGLDKRVTLRHMLHHVSGLPDFEQTEQFKAVHPSGTPEELRGQLKELCQYPSLFAPGTAAKYCNINFSLCALVTENVAGMPYAAYMKNEVFAPLGAHTAAVDREGVEIPSRVQGYEWDGTALVEVKRATDWMLGAGDVVATVDDVYCLNRAIKHRLLLKDSTWEMLLTPSPLNKMGMGCTVSVWHGKRRITHNGGHTGFRTLHVQLPDEDLDIILLSNSGFGDARKAISEMIHQAFYGKDDAVSDELQMDKGYIK